MKQEKLRRIILFTINLINLGRKCQKKVTGNEKTDNRYQLLKLIYCESDNFRKKAFKYSMLYWSKFPAHFLLNQKDIF